MSTSEVSSADRTPRGSLVRPSTHHLGLARLFRVGIATVAVLALSAGCQLVDLARGSARSPVDAVATAELPAGEPIGSLATPTPRPTATCAQLRSAWTAANQALLQVNTDLPREIVTGFRLAHDALAPINPPSGIAADWHIYADYVARINTGLGPVDPTNLTAVRLAIDEAAGPTGTDAAGTAAGEITAYLAAECVG